MALQLARWPNQGHPLTAPAPTVSSLSHPGPFKVLPTNNSDDLLSCSLPYLPLQFPCDSSLYLVATNSLLAWLNRPQSAARLEPAVIGPQEARRTIHTLQCASCKTAQLQSRQSAAGNISHVNSRQYHSLVSDVLWRFSSAFRTVCKLSVSKRSIITSCTVTHFTQIPIPRCPRLMKICSQAHSNVVFLRQPEA
jgi:hypothetical protein